MSDPVTKPADVEAARPAPAPLASILNRASDAAEERAGTSGILREQMYNEAKDTAIEIVEIKLQTTTTRADWAVLTDIPTMRMALVLQITPLVQVVLPKLGSDLMLRVGADPARWPTIRDLAHLGDLIAEHGLT
jgi:hypothetical protein